MDGIIVINKEKGYTSHDIVAITKKILNEKVGHTGTLDPLATGVLPLLVGKGTKLSKYLIKHDKIYKATLKLGIETDTGDITGNVLNTIDVSEVNEDTIKNILNSFKGKFEQYPPMYSAIKVNGKKLYEYAREGKHLDVKPRIIEIYNIELNEYKKKEQEIIFTVKCSKGTYIRSLCEDIAKKFNLVGCMKELERIQVGRFNIENSIKIEELKENKDNPDFIKAHFLEFEQILEDKPVVVLEENEITKFLNGVKLKKNLEDNIYKVKDREKNFIGTGEIKNRKLKRDIVL